MNAIAAGERTSSATGRRPAVHALAFRHVLLIGLLVAMLYPLVWMLSASFEPSAAIFVNAGLLPRHWTFSNYRNGWHPLENLSFTRLFLNSFIISCLAVAGNVCSCTLTAYAFARLRFRLRAVLFAIMLLTIMLPQQVLIIPQYIMFLKFGWLNTYLPLVVPRFVAVDAFYIFLMVQFMRALPRELDEAAIIDGCGHLRVFLWIIVPLLIPAMATMGLFTFLNTWNDFLGPLLYLTKPDMYTVPIGLRLFLDSSEASQWGPLFAMSILSLGPILAVFVASQRLLTEGITTTGFR